MCTDQQYSETLTLFSGNPNQELSAELSHHAVFKHRFWLDGCTMDSQLQDMQRILYQLT